MYIHVYIPMYTCILNEILISQSLLGLYTNVGYIASPNLQAIPSRPDSRRPRADHGSWSKPLMALGVLMARWDIFSKYGG